MMSHADCTDHDGSARILLGYNGGLQLLQLRSTMS